MELIESKSLLAKLMATENLTIEQRNVQTAAFDVKNRILTVPILDKNISGYLYDLFMGHEVGHALYTPLEGMTRAYEEKIPMGIMNVLEDSRIERKVKNKYPGIRSSFIRAYKELIDKDFFGTAGIDLNDLNFIDRVNLYTKGGASQGIKFTDFEKTLVDKIENTQSYDDVMEVARLVQAYLKEENEKRKAESPTYDESDEESDEEIDPFGYGDSDEEDWDDETESKKSKPSHEVDLDSEESEQQLGGDSTYGTNPENPYNSPAEDGIRSHTDEAFRKNESKLFANDKRAFYYGNIPDINLSEAIYSYKQTWTRYKGDVQRIKDSYHSPYPETASFGVDVPKFTKMRNDAKKVVGYLAKEFELRKNADQMKRASIAKTGELNMAKIYGYQLMDDIFKKVTVVPNGKSHGLVMFLDWSGSMHNHIENTMKQLINLVMFCKKVNIPYEVYAFSSEFDEPYTPKAVVGDIQMHGFKLINILSSKMTASEFTYAGSALVNIAQVRGWKPGWFQMGGTPLNETVVSAAKIIPEFQKQYKLQVVNTVFLTDGEGQSLRNVYMKYPNGNIGSGYNNPELDNGNSYGIEKSFVMRDPITKHEVRVDYARGRDLTSHFISILKKRTGCNIVGFFVLSGREFGREVYNFFPRAANMDKYKSEFRKNKCLTVTNAGYDEYYLLRSEGLDTDDDVEFVVKENATTRGLVSAFSKFAGNRLSNRVVLNRFIGMIA
jgi:hypothetical protein